MEHVTLWDWLSPLTSCYSLEIHQAGSPVSGSSLCSVKEILGGMCAAVYLPIRTGESFLVTRLLQRRLLCTFVHCFICENKVSFLWHKCWSVFIGFYVNGAFYVYTTLSNNFREVAPPRVVISYVCRGHSFCHSSATFGIATIFACFSCAVIFHCGINWHIPNE